MVFFDGVERRRLSESSRYALTGIVPRTLSCSMIPCILREREALKSEGCGQMLHR